MQASAPAGSVADIDMSFADRILVFGGAYSNLEATRALQAMAGRLGFTPDRIVCTGDVVAYCADPEATSTLVRDWGVHVVAGNCEEQVGSDADDCACGFGSGTPCDVLARSWYDFARRQVSAANKRWMASLPRRLRLRFGGHRLDVIHGGFDVVNRWVFASSTAAIAEELAKTDADVVVGGHCGVPFARRLGGRLWFNPGVIGMPANDGTPGVWYGIIAAADGALGLSTHRLDYDHAAAARKLAAAGFADPYAAALETGLWPSLDVLPPPERRQTGKPLLPLAEMFTSAVERGLAAAV